MFISGYILEEFIIFFILQGFFFFFCILVEGHVCIILPDFTFPVVILNNISHTQIYFIIFYALMQGMFSKRIFYHADLPVTKVEWK